MSMHNKPEYNPPELVAALKAYGMVTDTPSQLSDAFRLGWLLSASGAFGQTHTTNTKELPL
jgi:hypothetical protein